MDCKGSRWHLNATRHRGYSNGAEMDLKINLKTAHKTPDLKTTPKYKISALNFRNNGYEKGLGNANMTRNLIRIKCNPIICF